MNIFKWNTTRILVFGFAFIIILGAILLSLPFASRDGLDISFLDALFTSASATCVTGLVVFDTWTQFSAFGQLVILLLIQIGGLGFMAIAIFFSLTLGLRIGLRERSLLAEALSFMQVGGVVRFVRRMLIGTAFIEGLGAILLAIKFVPLFGIKNGIWFSIFHSVSAFCNAGFDLMGISQKSSSLTTVYNDPLIVLTIAILIIIGGIGFIVWNDLVENKFSLRLLRLHTRVVIFSTIFLLLVGTIGFLFYERNGVFSLMTPEYKILSAFFQSVTPRTAGFNTIDISSLSEGSKFITMLLMIIGAGPGSTGGGIKVTTFIVILATAIASLRGNEDITIWHFRLEAETMRRAFCVTVVYLVMTICGILILCAQGELFFQAAFECISAIGTVGLSLGITSSLSVVSKIVVIILMFTGRVGSLTFFMAVARSNKVGKIRKPISKLIVG